MLILKLGSCVRLPRFRSSIRFYDSRSWALPNKVNKEKEMTGFGVLLFTPGGAEVAGVGFNEKIMSRRVIRYGA